MKKRDWSKGSQGAVEKKYQRVEECSAASENTPVRAVSRRWKAASRRGSLGRKVVATMQAAEPGHGDDLGCHRGVPFGLSMSRGLFAQPKMRPVVLIIADAVGHEPLQMAFIAHDHMIEQVAAAASHEAFGNAILPRALEGRANGFDSDGLQSPYDLGVEDRIAVADEIF